MNIPWNEICHYTEVAAGVIGLFLIAVLVRALSNKVKELAEDKRFTAKERDDLYSFWFNACIDKEWGT